MAAVRLAIVETAPFGGLLHYAVQLGDALAGRGHAVELLVPRDHELAGRATRADVRAVLAAPVRRGARATGPAVLRRGAVALRLTRAWLRVIAELARRRRDVAIVNVDIDLSLVAGAALVLTALPRGPRVVVVAHSVRPLNRWGGEEHHVRSPVLRMLLGTVYRRCACVLVHGERSREEFAAAWPGARAAVIPHGDEDLFLEARLPAEGREPRALFFGVWRKVKGLPVLMAAFDRLAERRPEARLTLAGSPSPSDLDPEPIRRWAAGHGERVELREGYVELEEVPGLFGRARCLVAPYETAYQSGVVHLALTFGRAVVASDVGDLPDAVGGDAGLVVPAGDPAALADALEAVLFDAPRAAAMGAAARARAREHASWATVAERVEAALDAS